MSQTINDFSLEPFTRNGKNYILCIHVTGVVATLYVRDDGIVVANLTVPTVSFIKDKNRWINGVKNIFGAE